MIVLNEDNHLVNTDFVTQTYGFSVLSFEDFRNPDFYFRQTSEVMVYICAGIALDFTVRARTVKRIIVPLNWWILCTEIDEVQTMPLYELSRIDYKAFCCNPIDGFRPEYVDMRVSVSGPPIYPHVNWTSPPVGEKDLILIPITDEPGKSPLCAIFSTNRFEVSRGVADIWYADEPKRKTLSAA